MASKNEDMFSNIKQLLEELRTMNKLMMEMSTAIALFEHVVQRLQKELDSIQVKVDDISSEISDFKKQVNDIGDRLEEAERAMDNSCGDSSG